MKRISYEVFYSGISATDLPADHATVSLRDAWLRPRSPPKTSIANDNNITLQNKSCGHNVIQDLIFQDNTRAAFVFFSPGTSTCHLYVPCGYRLTGRFRVYVCPYVRLKSVTNGEEFQQPLGADARPTLNTRPMLLQFKLKSDSLDLTVLTLRVLIIGSYFPGYFCRL